MMLVGHAHALHTSYMLLMQVFCLMLVHAPDSLWVQLTAVITN